MTTNTSANDPTGERAAFAAGYAEAVATSKRIDDYQRTFLATGFTDAEKPLDTIVDARVLDFVVKTDAWVLAQVNATRSGSHSDPYAICAAIVGLFARSLACLLAMFPSECVCAWCVGAWLADGL